MIASQFSCFAFMDLCILTVTSSQIIIVLGILTDCVLAPEVKGLENG